MGEIVRIYLHLGNHGLLVTIATRNRRRDSRQRADDLPVCSSKLCNPQHADALIITRIVISLCQRGLVWFDTPCPVGPWRFTQACVLAPSICQRFSCVIRQYLLFHSAFVVFLSLGLQVSNKMADIFNRLTGRHLNDVNVATLMKFTDL